MIEFDFNASQIDRCRRLASELGFEKFQLVNHGRDNGPVFDDSGNLEYTLGNWNGEKNFNKIIKTIEHGDILLEDIQDKEKTSVRCKSIKESNIYISSTGDVYPCCYMGFQPQTYGKGRWHQPVNKQLNELIYKNNALEVGLKSAIEWFENIPDKWNIDTFNDGRLIVCDDSCGECKK